MKGTERGRGMTSGLFYSASLPLSHRQSCLLHYRQAEVRAALEEEIISWSELISWEQCCLFLLNFSV